MAIVSRATEIKHIGVTEAAEQLGVSAQRIRVLLKEGRVVGAERRTFGWLIPSPVQIIPPRRSG